MPALFTNVATLVTFIGVIALAVAGVMAMRRQEGQAGRSSDALWNDLRRAHGLSRRQVRLLRQAAERAGLKPESLIFLEPHVLMRLVDEPGVPRTEVHELMSRLYS